MFRWGSWCSKSCLHFAEWGRESHLAPRAAREESHFQLILMFSAQLHSISLALPAASNFSVFPVLLFLFFIPNWLPSWKLLYPLPRQLLFSLLSQLILIQLLFIFQMFLDVFYKLLSFLLFLQFLWVYTLLLYCHIWNRVKCVCLMCQI